MGIVLCRRRDWLKLWDHNRSSNAGRTAALGGVRPRGNPRGRVDLLIDESEQI